MVTEIRVQTENPHQIRCEERVIFNFDDVEFDPPLGSIEMWHRGPGQVALEHRMDEREPKPIKMTLEPEGIHIVRFVDTTHKRSLVVTLDATNSYVLMNAGDIREGHVLVHAFDDHRIEMVEPGPSRKVSIPPDPDCPSCAGEGALDSGALSPEGQALSVACSCTEAEKSETVRLKCASLEMHEHVSNMLPILRSSISAPTEVT